MLFSAFRFISFSFNFWKSPCFVPLVTMYHALSTLFWVLLVMPPTFLFVHLLPPARLSGVYSSGFRLIKVVQTLISLRYYTPCCFQSSRPVQFVISSLSIQDQYYFPFWVQLINCFKFRLTCAFDTKALSWSCSWFRSILFATSPLL